MVMAITFDTLKFANRLKEVGLIAALLAIFHTAG